MVAECGDLVLWRSSISRRLARGCGAWRSLSLALFNLERACSWLRSVEIAFSAQIRLPFCAGSSLALCALAYARPRVYGFSLAVFESAGDRCLHRCARARIRDPTS